MSNRRSGRFFLGAILISSLALSQVAAQDSKRAAATTLRVLITHGDAWREEGGEARTDEVIKALRQQCPKLVVTRDYTKGSDYIVRLDQHAEKANKGFELNLVVFESSGRTIHSNSRALLLPDAVRAVCSSIERALKNPGNKNPEIRPPNMRDRWPGAGRNQKPQKSQ